MSWIVYTKPKLDAQARLFCFHHSGGAASTYAQWNSLAPAEIEVCPVQLPGRERRLGEKPFTAMEELVPALADALLPHMDLPFGFFGHSMGARVAYALAIELRNRGEAIPTHLFVSASRAPNLPVKLIMMHKLSDSRFLKEIGRMGGTPPEVLASRELMDLLVPTMRADFQLIETYRPRVSDRLACNITAHAGDQDALAKPDMINAWSQMGTRSFTTRIWNGGHFYLKDHTSALVNDVCGTLFRSIDETHAPAVRYA